MGDYPQEGHRIFLRCSNLCLLFLSFGTSTLARPGLPANITMDFKKDDTIVVSSPTDKDGVYSEQYGIDDGNVDPSVPVQYRGTVADKKDMKVLGKTQVLRVCYSDGMS